MYRVTLLLSLLIIFVSYSSTHRNLRWSLNPHCDVKLCADKNVTTVYLRADGPNDTLHYLWDFVGKPSVLLAVTSTSGELNINWEDFILRKEKSVTFSEEPTYTYGVAIKEIIEYDDTNDTAMLNFENSTTYNILHPQFFQWYRNSLEGKDGSVELEMMGINYNDSMANITRSGDINLSLRGFSSYDYGNIAPYMLHTENSTEVDFVINNLQTNESFSNSRFAVELLVIDGSSSSSSMMSMTTKKNWDDEYTPGVFEIIEVKTVPYLAISESEKTARGYMQWRPVSYTTSQRETTSWTETLQYPLKSIPFKPTDAEQNSLLYCYYGEKAKDLLTERIIISLGAKGDGFYKKSNYLTWTFTIGYGYPPAEKFSFLVIMIISIGLGLPTLILLSVGIYICVQKVPKRRAGAYANR